MVSSHARVADTAKRKVLVGDVHDDIVYAGSARARMVEEASSLRLLGKDIEGKRLLAIVDECLGLLHG